MATKKQMRAGIKGGTKLPKVRPVLDIFTEKEKAEQQQEKLFFKANIDTAIIEGRSKINIRKGQKVYGLEPATQADSNKAFKLREKQRK